jgi:hypothetical protein
MSKENKFKGKKSTRENDASEIISVMMNSYSITTNVRYKAGGNFLEGKMNFSKLSRKIEDKLWILSSMVTKKIYYVIERHMWVPNRLTLQV